MARPPKADAVATRARIGEAASALFSERGLGSASLRDVARVAGVNAAMIGHYFGNKEGLYAACIEAMYAELEGLLDELSERQAEDHEEPFTVVETTVRIGYRFARAHREAVRLLQRSITDGGEIDTRMYDARILPRLELASLELGALTELPTSDVRLRLESAVFLVIRYSLCSDEQLERLAAGISKGGAAPASRAAAVIEEHLLDATLGILGLDPSS